jgi:hypothetical protein
MKKLYIFIAVLLITATTFAQAPEKMSYQAVLRNAGNQLLVSQSVSMQISILQATASGTAVYAETHTLITNTNGLVTLEIGTGSTTDNFSTIDWAAGPYFIKTETDPDGGTSYTITGTSQLLSTPYALYAKTATNVTNESQTLAQVLTLGNTANGIDIINTGQIVIGTASPNTESSLEIATPLPIIFPSMTQNEVNEIGSPVEGMVQFNTDARKLQVYAMLTDNAEIFNEIYVGSETRKENALEQSIRSPIDGQIIAVEVLLKANGPDPDYRSRQIYFAGQIYNVPYYENFTWFTFNLTDPIPISSGQYRYLNFGVSRDFIFATNSNYPNGSSNEARDSTPNPQDDLLFRVHIQPNPGSFGWQNIN